MRMVVLSDARAAAKKAAREIATQARKGVEARGRFHLAFSGGKTPGPMLEALAEERIPWERLSIVQVDERVAPEGHADRNLTLLQEMLLDKVPLSPRQVYAMPVDSTDLKGATLRYAAALEKIAGSPPVLDLVHLGLGNDGHTASLLSGDPVLEIDTMDVALTGFYQGRRRMTLTYPMLNRARGILWFVTGSDKAGPLAKLYSGDVSIPAGRVRRDRALILADAAAGERINRFHADLLFDRLDHG